MSRVACVTSDVGVNTDPDISVPASFIPPSYQNSRGTSYYTTLE